MCNIFSGHIGYKKGKEWGKIYYLSGVHHEEDRKKISHEQLLAWESKKECSLKNGFNIVHDCGGNVSIKEKRKLITLLNNWSKKQKVQPMLQGIALNDEDWHVREAATSKLTNQKVLEGIALNDENWHVREAAKKRLKK